MNDAPHFLGRPPGTWGPFRPTGAEAWRADGDLDGLRLFVRIGAHSSVTGKMVWLWAIAQTEGSWSLAASSAESREEAVGDVEELLFDLQHERQAR